MSQLSGDKAIYQKLIGLMIRAKRQMFIICESRNLTPAQGMLLVSMKPGETRNMNDLANMMGCDASNITGLIDRLETNGYIERAADEQDRRVKKIRLTEQGAFCREQLLDELQKAETLDTARLSDDELKTLHSLISKLI